MQVESAASVSERPLKWYEAWRLALQPSPATYQTLASSPEISSNKGYQWTLWAWAVNGILSLMVMVFRQGWPTTQVLDPIFAFVLGVLLGFLNIVLTAGIIHSLARVLGGKGNFHTMVYMLSASQSPATIIIGFGSTIGQLLPILGVAMTVFGYSVVAYQTVLAVFAVRATHQLSWGRSIISVAVLVLVIVICLAVYNVLLTSQRPL